MSADNYYAYFEKDGKWFVGMSFMSPAMDDCMHAKDIRPEFGPFDSEEKAKHKAEELSLVDYVEYGVQKEEVPKDYCGECWHCVYKRGIYADHLDICVHCNTPIAYSEGCVMAGGGYLHNSCYSEIEIQKRKEVASS